MATERCASSWQVKAAAGEPVAVIRVKNLQGNVFGPMDAWGRPGRQQPVLVSADFHFRQPFDSSSARDELSPDTVHYGLLSKAIAEVIAPKLHQGDAHGDGAKAMGYSLDEYVHLIWKRLTGQRFPNDLPALAMLSQPALVDVRKLSFMRITLSLPKASLLGQGVSFSCSAVFKDHVLSVLDGSLYGGCLRIHGLRVPTLIGVNPNERQAKQMVIADIELDSLTSAVEAYTHLESCVVQVRRSKVKPFSFRLGDD
jgi:dihydroneopterin aldolase